MLMPFDREFDDVYHIGIKEGAAAAGVHAERLDEQIFTEGMLERIFQQIGIADVIIADMSRRNANVFYEVGFAHAKDKLCILITENAEDIPFDLKHKRHIVYGDSLSYLRSELQRALEWATAEIENRAKSGIRVDIKPLQGDLATTDYTATGTVTFTVDLHNDSADTSAEIDAIYLYSKNNWTVKQDGRECAVTESDVDGFKYRYFVKPPILRLRPGSWAQATFLASKVLAYSWQGQEIKQEYSLDVAGRIRILTSSGSFDFPFKSTVGFYEIPF